MDRKQSLEQSLRCKALFQKGRVTGKGEHGSKCRWRPDRTGHVPRKPCLTLSRQDSVQRSDGTTTSWNCWSRGGRARSLSAGSLCLLTLTGQSWCHGDSALPHFQLSPLLPRQLWDSRPLCPQRGGRGKPSSGRKSQLLCRLLRGLGLAAGLRPLPWWTRDQLCRSQPLALALGEAACAHGGRDEATVGS